MYAEDKQRSKLQNRAGHKWFTEYAQALNDAGYDQKQVFSKVAYDIPNTPESFKELFRSFAKAMYGYESTTELSTKEFSEVCDVVQRELGEKLGVTVRFPSIEAIFDQQRDAENK